jgi:hypothetical protein
VWALETAWVRGFASQVHYEDLRLGPIDSAKICPLLAAFQIRTTAMLIVSPTHVPPYGACWEAAMNPAVALIPVKGQGPWKLTIKLSRLRSDF